MAALELVSVIVPAYNAAPYLGAAIDSLLAQSWPSLEIIVVDDGSRDNTLALARSYASRGVKVLAQENAGAAAARNRGLAFASGSLIKFFDADDVLSPTLIEAQVRRLRGRPECVASARWARFQHEPSEARFTDTPLDRDLSGVSWIVNACEAARPMMQPGLWLIPRRVLQRAGGWDERLTLIDDFEFGIRLLLACAEVLFVPEARLYYRSLLPNSLSSQTTRAAVESGWLSLELGITHLLAVEDSERTRKACANLLRDFEYTYYPEHADLRASASRRVRELGGSALPPDGPPGFQLLRRLVGWKIARRLERSAVRHRLNRVGLAARWQRRQG